MIIDIKIPSPGESISEVELAAWFVENGAVVSKDQEIGEIESEKATLPLIAEQEGKVELLAEPGDTLRVGSVICRIDTSVKPEAAPAGEKTASKSIPARTSHAEGHSEPGEKTGKAVNGKQAEGTAPVKEKDPSTIKITPVARKMMEQEGWTIEDVLNGLRKITTADITALKETGITAGDQTFSKKTISRETDRRKMSQLRKKISERLVAVKNETAMLTTFNEADMSAVISIRKKQQDAFVKKHGVKLGFMSFFAKAVTLALEQFPNVNAFLDGDELVYPQYCDVGIAVQTDKGLMVPVIRNAEALGLAALEKQILDIADRARKNRISMDELSGGTFTITNGGVFGSMLSTPILNPPQSAILGMHNIQDRPVAINGKVEIRPMMYLALSYDHRVIDGRDSVGFLKTVKEYIENPASMLFGPESAENLLLEL